MSYTWLKKLSTLSAYGSGAGPDGWLTICPILYLPALTTSLVKFHLRPNHIVKFLSKLAMVFPERNCPQTVEEALLIRFLNISSSFVCQNNVTFKKCALKFLETTVHMWDLDQIKLTTKVASQAIVYNRTIDRTVDRARRFCSLQTSAKSVISEI